MAFYSVKQYRLDVFRIVKFPQIPFRPGSSGVKVQERTNEEKLENNRTRARSNCLMLALCNDWEYFVNFTFSPDKFDRYDLFPIQNRLVQWFRDQRKKAGYENLAYLLVPEKHEDGAWHMHGFMSGIPASALSEFVAGIHPQKLVNKGYLNWGNLSHKFGFCSLDPIRDVTHAAFYCTKYFTKDRMRNVTDVGGHMYIRSQGLQTSSQLGYAYSSNMALDIKLTGQNAFCQHGWAYEPITYFFGELDDWCVEPLFDEEELPILVEDPLPEYENMSIPGFPLSGYKSPYAL